MNEVTARTCCQEWGFIIPEPANHHFKYKFTSSFSEVNSLYFEDFTSEQIKDIIEKALSKYPSRFRTKIHFEMMVKYKFLSSAEGDNVKYYKYEIGPGGSPASFEECQESEYTHYSPPPFPCDYTEYSISAPPSVPSGRVESRSFESGSFERIHHPCHPIVEQLLYGNEVGGSPTSSEQPQGSEYTQYSTPLRSTAEPYEPLSVSRGRYERIGQPLGPNFEQSPYRIGVGMADTAADTSADTFDSVNPAYKYA